VLCVGVISETIKLCLKQTSAVPDVRLYVVGELSLEWCPRLSVCWSGIRRASPINMSVQSFMECVFKDLGPPRSGVSDFKRHSQESVYLQCPVTCYLLSLSICPELSGK